MLNNSTTKRQHLNQGEPSRHHNYTVVVPIFDAEQAEWTVRIALNIAQNRKGRVVLVGMVPVPPEESLSAATGRAQTSRTELDRLRDKFKDEPIYIKPRIRVVHEPWRALTQTIAKEEADLVVIPWRQSGTKDFFAVKMDNLLGFLECNMVIVNDEAPTNLQRILMPIRGSQESPMVLEVALALARAENARITMLYSTTEDASAVSQEAYRELARISQGNPYITKQLDVENDALSAILEQVDSHDMVVLGASEGAPGSSAPAVGQIPRQLRRRKTGPMLVVKTHQPSPIDKMTSWTRPEPLPLTSTSVLVDRWFAENTFSSEEFKDLERLLRVKEDQGLTISLGLPALNEEETIGNVIQTMQDALMRQIPLLDEMVLIDSGSTDYTAEIARDYGVEVFQHSEILPQYGSYRGKGEALWKSLYTLKGDIIAWVDTDIVNIHPRFVYGIVGPILRHETVKYVKGFYRRPLKVGETLQAGGGGRVTELVARPMFNLFYPELSGIIQPLSGEYAGRREALERVPFYIGYGVETGLLLDLVEKYGLNSIAQSDLRSRIHRNQPLIALSRMAFAIIQVFMDHLEERQKVSLLHEVNRTIKIIRHDQETYNIEEYPISDQLRPAIISLPEYREKFGITDWEGPDFDHHQQDELLEDEELVA